MIQRRLRFLGLWKRRDFSRRGLVVGGLVLVGLLAVGAVLLTRLLWVEDDLTWERIQETGILKVCTDPSWPPFESFSPETGQIEGFDRDLADLLARRLMPGLQVQMVTVAFDSLYDALLSGRCDMVLSALPYEAHRTRDVSYSLSYFDAGLVLLTQSGSLGIAGISDLPGRAVGVEWGFVPVGSDRQQLILRQLGLRRYVTTADVLRALHAGEVDAALVDRISALTYLEQCSGLKIVGPPLADVRYAVPVRPDSYHLLEELNRALLEMREDGSLADLESKWF